MCEPKASYPLRNYHRSLVNEQVDANQAGALYSERVHGLGDDYESCQPGWKLTWDEYGRNVGTAGVKSAGANGCNVGVHSAEYRINVETATRPNISHVEESSFDALGLGRDIKSRSLNRQVSCGNPMPRVVGRKSSGYNRINTVGYRG